MKSSVHAQRPKSLFEGASNEVLGLNCLNCWTLATYAMLRLAPFSSSSSSNSYSTLSYSYWRSDLGGSFGDFAVSHFDSSQQECCRPGYLWAQSLETFRLLCWFPSWTWVPRLMPSCPVPHHSLTCSAHSAVSLVRLRTFWTATDSWLELASK